MLLFHARRLRFVREDNPPTSNLSVGTLYSMLGLVTIGDMTESGQRKSCRGASSEGNKDERCKADTSTSRWRFLPHRHDLGRGGPGPPAPGTGVYGGRSHPDYQSLLDARGISASDPPGAGSAQRCWSSVSRVWLSWQECPAGWPDDDGAGTCGLFDCYLHRRPQRSGDGVDLLVWVGRAETAVAATDGAFGLTEPEVGSGASRGLTTTARREGQTWVLSGQKKWIGNATFSDVTVIWARDVADNQVKGFLVEKGTPGFRPEKIKDKIALRVVQNALITLEDCRVPEANRLQQAHSFKDLAAMLRMTRAGVAWEAVGCARGAYELALTYAQEREQFGRPIGRFQLVQDLLVRMLGNITASACMVMRLSQMQDAGIMSDEHASLAKAFCTVRMRETVGYARELLAGNGILLDHHVGRFVADAEAIYSYEGTREMNSLIVGRAITGFSAFV